MEPQLRMLAGAREVELHLASGAIGRFDTDKIKQVVLNLFHNAAQHTDPEKGKIAISLASYNGWNEIVVSDNGTGIAEEHLPHLFDRFYRSESSRTRKSGGAGLGLSITKSIVEAHNGAIAVESRVGEGSRFIVRLPAPKRVE
jgi:two-component system OmpR family sensor kinase